MELAIEAQFAQQNTNDTLSPIVGEARNSNDGQPFRLRDLNMLPRIYSIMFLGRVFPWSDEL